ncbi:MAG: O-antigen ligase family protein, partial [Anaerolineae bacterium]
AVLIAQYGLVAVASLLYTTDFGRTQAGVISYVKDSLIVVAVTLLLQRKTTLRRAVWALLAAGIIMGTLSVIQQLTGDFENTYGGFAVASVKNIVGSSSDYRIGGPVKSPNFYALILVPLVPLALNRLWEEESAWRRGVAGWAAAVCILSIIFTFSRGGFLALVVVLGLTFVRRSLRPLTVLATVAALALLVQFVPAQYVARLSTLGDVASGNVEQEVSFRGRSSEIIVAWRMFADHPFTGVGYNDFKTHYLRYSEQLGLDPRSEDRSAHSLYLEVAAETGLLGLFSLGAILWAMFKGLYQARKQLARAGLPDYAGLVEAYGIGLIGYLTGSLFLHMAFPRFFWLLVGIALVVPHVAAVETQPQRRRAVAGQPAGMGLPVKL